jgi:site-specific recombinase XerD
MRRKPYGTFQRAQGKPCSDCKPRSRCKRCRRNGIWQIDYFDLRQHPVKRVYKSLGTRDGRLKDALAAELWENISSSISVQSAPRTFSEFIEQYISSCGTKAANTRSAYRDSLTQFQLFVGEKELSKISVRECEAFVSAVAKNHPSLYTASRHYRTLHAAFEKAVHWKILKENPFRQFAKPRVAEMDTDCFSEQDLRIFLAAIPETSFETRRLQNIAVIAFESGLRICELLNLQISNVDFDLRFINVRNCAADPSRKISAFTTKSKQQRSVPLSLQAAEAIRLQLKDNQENGTDAQRESVYLFPSATGVVLSRFYVSKLFLKYRRAALPERKGLHFHSLRHGYGTRLWQLGEPAQVIRQVMGHSTIAITERYTHGLLDTSTVRASLDAAAPYKHKERGSLVLLSTDKYSNAPQTAPNSLIHKHSQRRKRKTANV